VPLFPLRLGILAGLRDLVMGSAGAVVVVVVVAVVVLAFERSLKLGCPVLRTLVICTESLDSLPPPPPVLMVPMLRLRLLRRGPEASVGGLWTPIAAGLLVVVVVVVVMWLCGCYDAAVNSDASS
jgi:ABC-type glycerol-3-phosphate transport system permease component